MAGSRRKSQVALHKRTPCGSTACVLLCNGLCSFLLLLTVLPCLGSIAAASQQHVTSQY